MMDDRFPILRFFAYEHLPAAMQEVSRPFCELAHEVASDAREGRAAGIETSAALRKLLEAKDCAVRAFIAREDR